VPVNELYGTSETGGPASEAGAATWREASTGRGTADSPGRYPDTAQDDDFGNYSNYSDADIEAFLAAEERLPESRTRQQAAAGTWDGTVDDPGGSGLAAGDDGEAAALPAAGEREAESRTGQETAGEALDDTVSQGDLSAVQAAGLHGQLMAFPGSPPGDGHLDQPRQR
jgi:hypothetical protein